MRDPATSHLYVTLAAGEDSLPRIKLALRRPQRRRLQRALRKAKDPGFLRRCQVVLNYAANRGCTTTAEVLGCSPATAVRVAHRFLYTTT